MNADIKKLLLILYEILESKSDKIDSVRKFQNQIWELKIDNHQLEILNELAYDLDYYQPNVVLRKEDNSYFGEERLVIKIKSTIDRLNLFKLN